MTRQARVYLLWNRLHTANLLGPDDFVEACSGRLRAAMGLEPPVLPWYAKPGDPNPAMVGYEREHGHAGYMNRGMRRQWKLRIMPLTKLRKALQQLNTSVTR